MMPFERTPMWADVRKIIKDGDKPVFYEYHAIIHTTKIDMPTIKVIDIDIVRDYVNNLGDEIHITILLSLGDYVKNFYPFRENLEVTLKRRRVTQAESREDENREEERYKAVFLMDQSTNVRASEYETMEKDALDLIDIVNLKLQLINRALEPLRIKSLGGVFKDTPLPDIVKAAMTSESNKIKIEGNAILQAFDMVEPDNKEKRGTLMVPHSTLVSSLPSYIQETAGGLYNSGVGSYLQSFAKKITWFVFPLFNTLRFDTDVKKIVFYSVPVRRFPGIDRSYRIEGDVTHVIVNGSKAFKSTGEADFMDKGSGHRMLEARTVMRKPVKMTPEGPMGIRNKINHEIVTKDREDNLNYAPPSHRPVSSNPFSQASHTVLRTGSRIDLVWMNANPDLIYPGMPCKFIYLDKYNEVQEATGTIIFGHIYIEMDGKGIGSHNYNTSMLLTLYVDELEKPEEKGDPEEHSLSGFDERDPFSIFS